LLLHTELLLLLRVHHHLLLRDSSHSALLHHSLLWVHHHLLLLRATHALLRHRSLLLLCLHHVLLLLRLHLVLESSGTHGNSALHHWARGWAKESSLRSDGAIGLQLLLPHTWQAPAHLAAKLLAALRAAHRA